MVKLFISSQVTDKGPVPQLISFGATTDDGRHDFYAESKSYDVALTSDYLKQHVITLLDPQLNKSEVEIGQLAWNWLLNLPWRRPLEIEVFVTSHTDWEMLVDLLDKKVPHNVSDTPRYVAVELETNSTLRAMMLGLKDMNGFTKQAVKEFTLGYLDHYFSTQSPKHHSLYDAKATRDGWIRASRYIDPTYGAFVV